MLVCRLFFLILLPAIHYSAKVLVISGIRGSHLYITSEVADKLVEFGHEVTLLTSYKDPRVDFTDRNFTFMTYADNKDPYGKKYFERFEAVLDDLISMPSEDMIMDFIEKSEELYIREYNFRAMAYYTGAEFSSFLDKEKFNLIVLEQSEMMGASIKFNSQSSIPVIGIICVSEAKPARDLHSLPGLHNSEMSSMNDVFDRPPTFLERCRTLWRYIRFYTIIIPVLLEISKEDMDRTGLYLGDYHLSPFDIIFINDHPAFSFPYLTPPNTFYLGPFHLKDRVTKPLPETYNNFIDNCPHQNVVYLSFGTYFSKISQFSQLSDIIQTLNEMELCVIVRTDIDLTEKYNVSPTKFLQQKWVPQKDLLGSGKVHFFISHCGNNGRLESIFYKVPLLCIPLFGDQYHNARLVLFKKFGLYLKREQLTAQTFERALNDMLEKRIFFVERMTSAVDQAVRDPGAGTEMLRFYSDLLIKNGDSEFLINRIIENQWSHEIFNLDILFAVVLLVLGSVIVVVTLLCKLGRNFCRGIATKSKEE